MSKLIAIDGKSVFYRGYYAMPYLALPDGTPTGGVYGFASMALESLKRFSPDYAIVAWDKKGTNIRSRLKLYPEYKAGRKPMPDDMRVQIPMLMELLDAFGWPLFELDDYEADDLLGVVAKQAYEHKRIESILITSDQDSFQLINKHTKVANLKRGLSDVELLDVEKLMEEYGVTPEQMIDLKSIMGDSSDNIPGVKGIGRIGAMKLLDEFKTLENIYENIEMVTGATKNKLLDNKDMAFLSKQLVTLQLDAPMKVDFTTARLNHVDPEKVIAILEKFAFKSLLREIPENWGVDIGSSVSKPILQKKASLPKLISIPTKIEKIVVLHQFLDRWFASCSPSSYFELDKLDDIANSVGIVGYDAKDILKKLTNNLDVSIEHDIKQAGFLLNPLDKDHGFEHYADSEIETVEQAIFELWQLYKTQKEMLLSQKMNKLVEEIEWPVSAVLARMEARGIRVDSTILSELSIEVEDEIAVIEQKIYGLADQEFNISSPRQLAVVLYDDIGLPTEFIKKTKSGFSTAHSELSKLQQLHPIVDEIIRYREITKLLNTYIRTLPEQVETDGRIHTQFDMDVASTGRLSSREPNLQNIPVRTELGRKIRSAFIPSKKMSFIHADYSQFELRIAAVLSGEADMIKAFTDGVDIHKRTAAQIFGLEEDKVSDTQRYQAKAVNFGIMYGQGVHGLSQGTGLSYSDAKQFIDAYFAVRPKLAEFIEETKMKAKNQGFVETIFGRRRPTPDVRSSNFIVREAAFRAAVNMPIQGSAADLMKFAMVKLEEVLPKTAVQLVQVHDSILIEASSDEAESVAELVKKTMESVYGIGVPLKVDTKVGKNWGEL
jgi:DNA polymerase-1